MLDYSENINIVKIIIRVPELSRFRLAYSRGPLSTGQIIIDKLKTEHNERHRSFGVNISRFSLGTMQTISFIHKAKKGQT